MNDCINNIGEQIEKRAGRQLTDKEIAAIINRKYADIDRLVKRGYDIETRPFIDQWQIVLTYKNYSVSIVSDDIYGSIQIAHDFILDAMTENEP